MLKMNWCWGSNDGFIWEERTAFIIRRVFAMARKDQRGVTHRFDFAESITSVHPRNSFSQIPKENIFGIIVKR